jgi:glycosyltransferase involved in cell wall biosynthesis
MSYRGRSSRRVLVIGPGSHCKGGITAVINNYTRTTFWTEFGCRYFSSATEGSAPSKAFYALYRYVVYLLTIIFSRPTAISLHTASGISFYRKFMYLLAARALRIPVVVHIHPAQFIRFCDTGPALLKWMIRWSGNSSRRIVFLSEGQRRDFLAMFPADKMVVIGNPVDMKALAVWRDDWRAEPLQVLFMGWIVREKGVYDLVEAMPHVLKEFPDAIFVFAGPKSADQLRDLLAERGLERSARVVGWVAGEDRVRLLRTSRMLILPSYTEGVPNVILEAMASRLPVITTPVGGIPSVVQDDVSCLFIQPRDVASIAAAICRLLRDDQECRRLAESAWAEASCKYDIEVVGERLRQVYGAVAGENVR